MAQFKIKVKVKNKKGEKVKDIDLGTKEKPDKGKFQDVLIFEALQQLPDGEYNWEWDIK